MLRSGCASRRFGQGAGFILLSLSYVSPSSSIRGEELLKNKKDHIPFLKKDRNRLSAPRLSADSRADFSQNHASLLQRASRARLSDSPSAAGTGRETPSEIVSDNTLRQDVELNSVVKEEAGSTTGATSSPRAAPVSFLHLPAGAVRVPAGAVSAQKNEEAHRRGTNEEAHR